MLTKLSIRNFQSIKAADLELGRFTAILGPSDVGKSALFRAVSAACTNQAGREFISYGTKKAAVSITTEADQVVWVKDASSSYVLFQGSSKQEFTKTGRTVPDEILAALGLGPVLAGDVSFVPTFHQQFDKPFLVADSANTRAKILGELSGVNLLVLATAEARRREQAARRLASVRESDREREQAKLTEPTYADLDAAVLAVSAAEEALAAARALALRIARAETLVATRAALEERLSRIEAAEALARRKHEALAGLVAPDGRVLARMRELDGLVCDCGRRLQRAVRAAAALRERYEALCEKVAAIQTCPTCGQILN